MRRAAHGGCALRTCSATELKRDGASRQSRGRGLKERMRRSFTPVLFCSRRRRASGIGGDCLASNWKRPAVQTLKNEHRAFALSVRRYRLPMGAPAWHNVSAQHMLTAALDVQQNGQKLDRRILHPRTRWMTNGLSHCVEEFETQTGFVLNSNAQ